MNNRVQPHTHGACRGHFAVTSTAPSPEHCVHLVTVSATGLLTALYVCMKKKQKYFVGMRNAFLIAFKNTEPSNPIVATTAAIYAAQQ